MATDTTPAFTKTTFSEVKAGDKIVMFGRGGPKVHEIADAIQGSQTTRYRYVGEQAVWEAPADWPVKVVD